MTVAGERGELITMESGKLKVPDAPNSPAPDPVAAELAALDREEQEMMRLQLAWPGWLRDNPGLSLTMLYLFASVVGMVFHYLLLKRFGGLCSKLGRGSQGGGQGERHQASHRHFSQVG